MDCQEGYNPPLGTGWLQTAVRLVLFIGDSNPRGKILWIRSSSQTLGGRVLTMGELATFSILQSDRYEV